MRSRTHDAHAHAQAQWVSTRIRTHANRERARALILTCYGTYPIISPIHTVNAFMRLIVRIFRHNSAVVNADCRTYNRRMNKDTVTEWLTIAEFMKSYPCIKRSFVYSNIEKGRIPALKIGGKILIPANVLDRMLEERMSGFRS
jgi:excisionase family DNA binding protein